MSQTEFAFLTRPVAGEIVPGMPTPTGEVSPSGLTLLLARGHRAGSGMGALDEGAAGAAAGGGGGDGATRSGSATPHGRAGVRAQVDGRGGRAPSGEGASVGGSRGSSRTASVRGGRVRGDEEMGVRTERTEWTERMPLLAGGADGDGDDEAEMGGLVRGYGSGTNANGNEHEQDGAKCAPAARWGLGRRLGLGLGQKLKLGLFARDGGAKAKARVGVQDVGRVGMEVVRALPAVLLGLLLNVLDGVSCEFSCAFFFRGMGWWRVYARTLG